MTARIALLMVAVAGLAACESTKAVSTAPATPVAVETQTTQDTTPRIVRSPIVPDDDVEVASYTPPKKRVKSASTFAADPDPVDVAEPAAPVSKPEKPSKPEKADAKEAKDTKSEPAPVTTADASSTPPPASPSDGAPTPADTAPDSAAPTTDATPAADGTAKSIFSDPSSFMQAQIGGFPVWLIALVGIVVFAALILSLGGRRKPEEVV